MQKIEAVIFDLGGVILDIDYNLTRKAFEKLGVANFNKMYSQASADQLFRNLETGKIKESDFYVEFNKCIGFCLTSGEICEAWNSMLLKFREKSLVFLTEIRSRYRLFLLSNTNKIHYDKFKEIYQERDRAIPFENFFEKAYYSFEIGMRKPDSDIYEYVLQANRIDRKHTVFIDDSLQNIHTAKSLGMQTILLETGNYIENTGL